MTMLLENSVTPAVMRHRIITISQRGRSDNEDKPEPINADNPDFYKKRKYGGDT